ncbi:DUF2254 domain-containing protein [Aliiglaciecola sp. LCG003]|uniref:DUF2254 domain-containing protein n=1 Tax=Aliiglaciecola sp. LCG003 TaxID=3053655 RepID=UPI0025744219|nr:DUF2254 domain-containing protein [Aliiglaciecola sp. LCG003]WJG09639.1 DUF2254 domain-containing protein [Aliiglaciecola sp. LCG003]
MNTRLLKIWDSLQSSFWFLPSLMVCAATLSAKILLAFDHWGAEKSPKYLAFLYEVSAESVEALLTTIASAMITATTVAFSITVVALTLASSQFGPRLIRNFMMDKGTQVVLGVFISTFIYCLLILQGSGDQLQSGFIPGASTYVAVFFAFVGTAFLIYFIHHVARSIQADNVVDQVYESLQNNIDRLFPDSSETQPERISIVQVEKDYPHRFEVVADKSGYIQALNTHFLTELSCEHDIVVEIHHSPGDFVVPGIAVLSIHQKLAELSFDPTALLKGILFGSNRTPVQDPEYAIHQLVEIAVRSLSPGINDPYTAITCVDKLSAVLCSLSLKTFPQSCHFDEHKNLRVVTKPTVYQQLAEPAFDQIRQYGVKSVAVTIRLIESLRNIQHVAQQTEIENFVYQQLSMIEEIQNKQSLSQGDREDLQKRIDDLKAKRDFS